MKRSRLLLATAAAVALVAMMVGPAPAATSKATAKATAKAAPAASKLPSCAGPHLICTEVHDSEEVFGEGNYVGHDEPSLLFYSNRPGSGNRYRSDFFLPRDPKPSADQNVSYTIELRPTFWFGMALCDTQSYPEQLTTCPADSDANIVDPAASPRHAGTAFMELQFYPPGFVQQFTGFSCDARQWCAALTIDSLARDPVAGADLNTGCQRSILGGLEYVNFAYITRNGKPQGPPDPLHFDPVASGQPDPAKALFMNQGDHISVALHDTREGLRAEVRDLTTHRSGFMTASARNGFGQIKFAPAPSTECTELPYDFHPMYATSSPATRVPWAAHSYNVAFSDEIGHFDFCSQIPAEGGSCTGLEGVPGDQEPADGDDNGCFSPALSTLLPIQGCLDTNSGFDGTSYKNRWPNGSRKNPTSVYFSSFRTGRHFDEAYRQAAFEADLPRIEAPDLGGPCDRTTGAGCTIIPLTDDGTPVDFYPFYTKGFIGRGCFWSIGNDIPGFTRNDFGRNAQYGALLPLSYTIFGGGGASRVLINDFRQVLPNDPCARH